MPELDDSDGNSPAVGAANDLAPDGLPALAASVIIPSFNGAQKLPTLLDALARQDTILPWEAIVVIDGSDDDTESVIASTVGVPLRTVVLVENEGISAALNAGFEVSRGKVLIRCDDDLEPRPDFVRLHIESHEGEEHFGTIGPCKNVLPDTPFSVVYGREADRRRQCATLATPPSEGWRVFSANTSVTRDDYVLVGPYSTAFRAYGWEDIEWGYRLAKAGVPCRIQENLTALHFAAATSTKVRVLRAFHSGRGKARFEAEHRPLNVALSSRSSIKSSAWTGLVEAASAALDERRIERLGSTCDRVINYLPWPLATKAVALLVEASGRAGERSFMREVKRPSGDTGGSAESRGLDRCEGDPKRARHLGEEQVRIDSPSKTPTRVAPVPRRDGFQADGADGAPAAT